MMSRLLLIAVILVGAVTAISAQPPAADQGRSAPQRGPGPAPGAEAPDALSDVQLLVMLDSYAMFQAQQQLSISDENFGTFAARLKKLQDTRRRNQRQRHRIVQELRRLAGPRSPAPGDDAAIRAQLVALREHDDRAAAELRAAYDGLDAVLDPRQQARYRIFEEQIERRKIDLLLRAQERARQGRQ
jgi:hypothetical protein